jgi:hypothetical protein
MKSKNIEISRLNIRVKGPAERSGREFGAAFGQQLLAQLASSAVLRDLRRGRRIAAIDAGCLNSGAAEAPAKQAAVNIATSIAKGGER